MPASFIQAIGHEPAGAASAITSSALSITTGRYLFVHGSHYTTGINISAVIQTSGGNTFIKAGTTQGGDANQDGDIWYTPSPITGTTSATFQVRYTGNADFRIVQVAEFSWGSVDSISFEVESAHNLVSTSAKASLTLTTGVADNLILGAWVAYDFRTSLSTGSATMIGPATTNADEDDFALGYRTVDSASAYTVTLIGTVTDRRYSVIAKAFKGVTGAGTATAATLTTLPLLGVGR